MQGMSKSSVDDALEAKFNAIEEELNQSSEDEAEIAIKEAVVEKVIEEVETPAYDAKHVRYDGEKAIYKDPDSGYEFEWDKEKEEWVAVDKTSYGYEDDTHTYTDADGIKYFWDKDKNAWFPKINDDFMAQYQMNYGFIDNTNIIVAKTDEVKPVIDKKSIEKGVKRKPSEPTWFELDQKQNTKVYVSNLPLDITELEFVELMQKCGIIMRDTHSGQMKIKLYTDSDKFKGDALCTYIRTESVELALKLLDGYEINGHKIKVELAKFQLKGEYNPKLKPRSKKRKDKEKLKLMQEKLFDWRPEKMRGERSKHEKIVIIKNLFESKQFDEDAVLILELQEDLRSECSKCGDVGKVIIYDRHPEGVAQVNMKTPEEADACVKLLHNRWFMQRQLRVEIWDGKAKYKIQETDSQISQRLEKWDKFLVGDEAAKLPILDKAEENHANLNELEPNLSQSEPNLNKELL